MAMEADACWRRIQELFHRASELPPDARAAQLREWCAGEESLQREVESLLDAALEAEAEAGRAEDAASTETDPWIGRTIGAFRLERLIGRGGMGAVYLGRRISGDFEQQIAFKLATSRFVSPWLRERFLQERQTLAALSHPNIARLLDGGLTDEGEPYLVMEYIDGLRMDHYCERTGASVENIVRLFLQLCDAVGFVHRHLIVHRDLKPANVLVTPEGQVKLLDFGAAKLLNPDPHVRGETTRLGMRALTPQYASPEQLLGAPVNAASDVYSLGAILYRLLTGRAPFGDGGPDADLLGALDRNPLVPPHAAIATRAVQEPAAASAVRRDIRLRRSRIRGDMDAIVLKALSPSPAERYASVDELEADLRNYLEHRPVWARDSSSLRYRASKFVRRHTLGIGATLAIAIALTGGVTATVHAGMVAAREEQRARVGFREVRRLANLLLFDFYDQVKQLQGSTDVQRRLAAQALRYLDGLARDAVDDPDIQLDLVEAYTKMGNVLGNPYEENLGDTPKALASLEKAVSLASGLRRLRPDDTAVTRRLGMAQIGLSEVHFSAGNTARAIEYSRIASEALDALAARPGAAVSEIQEAASSLDSLGDLYGLRGAASVGDLGAARESYRRALDLHRRCLARDGGNVRSQRGVAILLLKIGNTRSETEPEVAAQDYAEALAALDRLPEKARNAMPTPRVAAIIRHKLGSLYADIERPREAIPQLASARDLFATLAERDPDDTRTRFDLATVEYDLGDLRAGTRDLPAARRHYRNVLRIVEGLLDRSPSNLVWMGHRAEALYRLARLDRALGDPAAGDRNAREALNLALSIAANAEASAVDLDRIAGFLLAIEPAAMRDPGRALEFAQRAAEKSRGANAGFLLTLARAQQARGRPDDARMTLQRALALLPAPSRGRPTTALRRAAESLMAALN